MEAAGVDSADLGIVVAPEPGEVVDQVIELLGQHRVWDRFEVSVT